MKLAIIDMDSVMFSIGNGIKLLDESGEPLRKDGKFVYRDKTPKELIESADFMMKDILSSCGATHYLAYIKGKNTRFRAEYKEDYKANRPKESPKWWKFVKEYLKLQWKIIEVDNIEVDDMVSITSRMVQDSFIVAIDKDLLQLPGRHFNWRTKEFVTTTGEEAKRQFWVDMISGQPGDNIKGIPGKGPKYVEKAFGESTDESELAVKTFMEYLKAFDIDLGIKEFVANYRSLYILQDHPDFVLPDPVEVNIESKETVNIFE